MKYALIVLATIALMLAATPAVAQEGPCSVFRPYYHSQTNSLGSRMADVVLFAFSLPAVVILVGGPRRNVVNPQTRQASRVSSAACLPLTTAEHFVSSQPPQAEHWQIE